MNVTPSGNSSSRSALIDTKFFDQLSQARGTGYPLINQTDKDYHSEESSTVSDAIVKAESFQVNRNDTKRLEIERVNNLKTAEKPASQPREQSREAEIKRVKKNSSTDVTVDLSRLPLGDDTSDFEAPLDHTSQIKSITKFLADLKAQQTKLARKHIDGIDQSNELLQLDNEIRTIQELLNPLLVVQERLFYPAEGNNSGDIHRSRDGSPAKKINEKLQSQKHADSDNDDEASNLVEVIKRRTTTRRRAPERSNRPANMDGNDDDNKSVIITSSDSDSENQSESGHKSANTTPVKKPNTPDGKPDDIEKFSSPKIREKIVKIDNKIMDQADKANALLTQMNALRENLNPKTKSPPSPRKNKYAEQTSKNSSAEKKRLEELKIEHTQLLASIGKLYVDRDSLGKPVMLPPEKDEIDPDSVKASITENTRTLEADQKRLHDEFIANVNEDPYDRAKTLGWNCLAGAAAFGTSFLITNTISRVAPPWFSYVAPIVVGTLHTVVATPTAKSLMRRAWRGKALAESNNYFRLLGACWGDNARDQQDAKKYADKSPDKKGLITIEERRAEDRPLSNILWDRYKTEELPYFSYSVMYSAKGAIEANLPSFLKYSVANRSLIDIGPHALAGAISGAIYLAGQQLARSTLPNNATDIVLSPEVYAAQARALRARREDLMNKIASLEKVNTEDPHIKPLLIALRKTENKLIVATAKSGRLSGWGHEFLSQFKKEVVFDTLAEILGRAISLAPTTGVAYLTASMRASNNPLFVGLGHALPAIVLIAPPGFQARGIYSGLILAALQAFRGTGDAPEKNTGDGEDSEIRVDVSSDAESDSDSERVTLSEGDETSEEGLWRGQERETDAARV